MAKSDSTLLNPLPGLNCVAVVDVFVAAGAIPATLGELTSLKILKLHENELSGECFGRTLD